MILKSLMEDKQLDLDQPFISVRRLPIATPSSEPEEKRKAHNSLPKKASLPLYKSELKSGPIRNPGTVPFRWEQTPGRPKDESKTQTHSLQHPQLAPNLPPGRSLNLRQQSTDKDSASAAITRLRIGDVLSSSQNTASFNELLMKHEDEVSSDSDDDDSEAYMDARDTLSRTESSSFLNCSLSGLSGLESPIVKPFGSFSDAQTRDFMMGRFLPAAKAMASESPHYTNRKQPVARDQPRQVNMIANVNKRESLYQHRPRNVQHYVQRREAEDGKEDSDDEAEAEYSSGKGCGLLPQLCLMNPVPGLRMKGRGPISLVPREHKAKAKVESKAIAFRSNGKKLHGSSLYHQCMQSNGISPNQNEMFRGKARKNLREILANKSTEWELGEACPVVEKTLYIDSVHVVKSLDSNSSCSDTKGNDFEILVKEEKEETHSVDCLLQDVKHLDKTDGLMRRDQNLIQSSMTSITSRKAEDARIDSGNELITELNSFDSFRGSSGLPLPPPLPKSPSESWLSRTLPVVSLRNQSPLGRTRASKTPSLDPKWETIVKTSNVHHGHLRFSEELLTPIPET